MLMGCEGRFCAEPPEANKTKLRSLRKHVRWRVKQFTPIQPGQLMTVPEWLAVCPYPLHRKVELQQAWDSALGQVCARHLHNDSHGKKETYIPLKPGKFKLARGINSRSDVFKCATGPAFKQIEEEVFKHRVFIKHTPVCMRPQVIVDELGGFPGPFYETDYSQFEKHFKAEIMESMEMILYEHMLQHYPQLLSLIRKAMLGTNVCKFKHFTIKIDARRMSGEMCTSLGNGFSNWMLADFIATSKGGSITGFVEGDDGLFYSSVPLTVADFAELGFDIKMLRHLNLLRTSFCGLVMSEDLITMTDPRKVLINFGWTHSLLMHGGPAVISGLLKAKALSLAYEHPRCPILSVLARRVISQLPGVRERFEGNWYEQHLNREVNQFKEETAALLAMGPSQQSRLDFAELFDISVEQQLHVEAELNSWTGGPLDGPWTQSLFDSSYDLCRDYHDRFTSPLPFCPTSI